MARGLSDDGALADLVRAEQVVEKKKIEGMGYEVKMDVSHSEAITRVTEALKTEGFGVLTRADVDQAFRDKIGVEFRPGSKTPDLG